MHSKGLAGETEIFVRYGVTDRLELGLGYLRKQNIVRPLVSYVLVPETAARPSLTTGAMIDALEDGRQMVFLTVGKSFPTKLGVPVNVYGGVARVTTTGDNRWLAACSCPLPGG
ncbi:MAG: hypothetical protein IT207_05995 [Fimbriimonadaceae bacterium]|nr:hypothetical protein [Fimbriimonadaceae bacterium]